MKHELEILLNKHLEEALSEAERLQVAALLHEPDGQLYLTALLDEQLNDDARSLTGDPATGKRILETVVNRMQPVALNRIHFLKTAWFRYAAVVLLMAGTATFLYLNNRPEQEITKNQPLQQPDIQPGGNKAILTLSDGSTIVLDSAVNGALAQQGETKIVKTDMGALVYEDGGSTGKVGYNTISTPKGGQYQVTLPDGTKVWLNAASSITFPTAFKTDRVITITGEAYLEVATDRRRPLLIKASETEIHVLGTSLNVNAYPEEAYVKTSLLEGSIKIKNTMLSPGEAFINGRIVPTDVQQDVAWRTGLFNFNHLPLEQIMRQLGRWYSIDVTYQSTIPHLRIYGKMGRDLTLQQMLKILTTMGLNYRLEGHKLIILP